MIPTTNQAKNKGGRPKLPTSKKRSVAVHFKVNATEYQYLQGKAESEGLNLSTWLRLQTLKYPQKSNK